MGRPQIYLKDWCSEDGLLKAEFIKKESENPRGLVIKTHQISISILIFSQVIFTLEY